MGTAVALPGGAAGPEAPILPLTSTSEVILPPPGRSFMNFGFDFPEPSVDFRGYRFGFRVFTYENVYVPDRRSMRVVEGDGGARLEATAFTWAGGQETSPGRLVVSFRPQDGAVVWQAEAEHPRHNIKAIAAVVRTIPRGRISAGAARFFDPGDDEVLYHYPVASWGIGPQTGQSAFPFLVVETRDGGCLLLDCLDDQVRPKRFFLQPAQGGWRAELIVEEKAHRPARRFAAPPWRILRARHAQQAFRAHQEHFERAFRVPTWESRGDVPGWMRGVRLVLNIHGAHWTGFVFNTFARMEEILAWVATQIDPRQVLVFLPAWDGRYYWNYPLYEPDPRMGGAAGLKRLVGSGHRLGYRFMPMFGCNANNNFQPKPADLSTALALTGDGNHKYIDNADWDADRRAEGWDFLMNLGAPAWRKWLGERISKTIATFGMDAYFLDITHGYVNDARHDMYEGARLLVEELAGKHPGVLACGEAYYDALFAFLPLYHVFGQPECPDLVTRYVRAFSHLSHPAPGRGSSGVHERGFARFSAEPQPQQIQTLSVVEDTFSRYREQMAGVIRRAKG